MGWRERVAERLFGDVLEERARQALKATDDAWWRQVAGGPAGAAERPWHSRREELEAALAAWRENPLARRIVGLTTDYVLGDGITVRSDEPAVERWVRAFWDHPQNHMAGRLPGWCDELSRAGELFVVLSRNPADGMSYVRTVPASRIDRIETDADDAERVLRYHELAGGELLSGRWWPAAGEAGAEVEQVMLHFAINRPAGALRGEGDLTPILRWLEHYASWLEDRVRVNRLKSAFVWQVTLSGATAAQVAAKRAQYGRPPAPGSIIITNENERWQAVQPRIDAESVEADGKAIRLMAAAGAGVPLHFLSEGESATRATAAEMGDPTLRHYRRRQMELCGMVVELCAAAYRRAALVGAAPALEDLRLRASAPEIARDDNESLARAAAQMVQALTTMRAQGWIDDRRAAELALRAAGAVVSAEDVTAMLGDEISDEIADGGRK